MGKKERKNNIVIKGLDTGKGSVTETVQQFLEETIKTQATVKEAYELGKGTNKIIITKLETWEMKKQILEKKGILRRTKIYIDDDLTRYEREVQRKIREEAKELKERGMQVKIGYRKLKVGDKWLQWNDKEERLQESHFL